MEDHELWFLGGGVFFITFFYIREEPFNKTKKTKKRRRAKQANMAVRGRCVCRAVLCVVWYNMVVENETEKKVQDTCMLLFCNAAAAGSLYLPMVGKWANPFPL
ncbi:hypothetical protein QBC35DRAFT_159155 [Podospora australis]|uniref:Uncharacterized protein n=1 Tax=Podospora australis TaxID=1536484 RepID=A0AAN6X427_9PEZI|nr:hypothetical protein QBC35DRAFT_159155 [Podospora australis]